MQIAQLADSRDRFLGNLHLRKSGAASTPFADKGMAMFLSSPFAPFSVRRSWIVRSISPYSPSPEC